MGKTKMSTLTRILCKSARIGLVQSTRSLSVSSIRTAGEGPNTYKKTHTGQVYEEDDYRNIRFVGRDKLINPQWAIDLIAEDPVVVVNGNHAWSDSCGALG